MSTQTRANWAESLVPGINQWIHDEFKQMPVLYSQIFSEETSQRSFEEDQVSAGISDLTQTDELNAAPDKDKIKAYATRYSHLAFRGKMKVSKEAFDDDLYGVFKRDSVDMGKSGRRTYEKQAFSVFRNAFSTSNLSYGDNKPLCSTVHTRADGGTSQSNASSTGIELTEENLETATLQLQEVLDDAGQIVDIGDGNLTLMVPRKLRKIARVLSESESVPSVANNDINVYKGMYTVVSNAWISSLAGGSDTAWFLIDKSSAYLKFFMRENFNVEHNYDPDTRALITYANTRFSYGWSHWLGVFGSKGDLASYSS